MRLFIKHCENEYGAHYYAFYRTMYDDKYKYNKSNCFGFDVEKNLDGLFLLYLNKKEFDVDNAKILKEIIVHLITVNININIVYF